MNLCIPTPSSFQSALEAFDREGLLLKPKAELGSQGDLNTFLETIDSENSLIAIDTETDSLDPYTAELVGFSVYDLFAKKAYYFPVKHNEADGVANIPLPTALSFFVRVFETLSQDNPVVYFNAEFDMLVIAIQGAKIGMNPLSLKPKAMVDVQQLVDLMQFVSFPSLKDLTIQYGITEYNEVTTYEDLILNCFGHQFSLAQIQAALKDPESMPNVSEAIKISNASATQVFSYGADDAIHTNFVFLLLLKQYIQTIEEHSSYATNGLSVAASNLIVQGSSQIFFTFANINGILVNMTQVEEVIEEVSKEYDTVNEQFRLNVRKAMGWSLEPPQGKPAKAKKEKPVQQPSLFDQI